MATTYILAVDQSTSGTKAILFGEDGGVLRRADISHKQYYPRPGWVEHDPEDLYRHTLEASALVLRESGLDPSQIRCLAISNQRETALVWDRKTGKAVHNAVVWQCKRGEDICRDLENAGMAARVKEKTGLVLSPYFSAAKIRWILDNVEGARAKAAGGELACGTVDSWLLWRLSGGAVHATDYSNASRTQLFNLSTLTWDDELLDAFAIPRSMMGEVAYSDREFCRTDLEGILPAPIPVYGIMGDSHAALFAQNCYETGMAKATYGTGSSIMMNIGKTPLRSKGGLVTSVAWGMDGSVEYVFEGNINSSGATIQWLVDDLELISSAKEAGSIASTVPDTQGVYLVPAFVGLSAPYWDSEARAAIVGMSRGTKKAHVVRAAEESMAYQIRDIIDLMKSEAAVEIKELRVDGGPTKDQFLMQFQADLLGTDVVPSTVEELSAAGAAFMAGIASGLWAGKKEVSSLRRQGPRYSRTMDEGAATLIYRGWRGAVERTLTRERVL